jgi:hypothetical protein
MIWNQDWYVVTLFGQAAVSDDSSIITNSCFKELGSLIFNYTVSCARDSEVSSEMGRL